MTTTLPLFWHLSSASKKERIDASVKLVGSLEQFQAQFTQKVAATNSASDEEDEDEDTPKSDGLDLTNSQDVSYSIRRLIRGLASARESSRLGFAVALTELLSRIDTVTCSQILNIIIDYTKNLGSMTGQEERDILFSKLFGIMSIIQSGLAVRTKPLATSASSSTAASSQETYEQMISLLVELGEKKSWLRESAWYALSLAIQALHESNVAWKDAAVDKIVDILFVSNTAWFTEKVALTLKLQEYYPKRDWKGILSPTFKNPDLLTPGNLPTISRILKESTTDEDGTKDLNSVPSGTWRPQLNFSWDIILEQMLPGPNSTKAATGSFQDFFKIVVDEALFSSTSSPQKKLWGFQVFQKSLKRVTADTMPMLFTKNFMRSWINHLSKKDRHLHKVAQQTTKEVQAFVEGNPQLGFALILQLTGVNGSQQFDKLTKTKTVESILSSLNAQGIQDYVDHLLAQIDEPEGNPSEITITNSRRSWIIEQLGALIRNGKIPKEDNWVLSILNWLVVHGLFIVKKKSPKNTLIPLRTLPNPAFSDELRKSCRNKLLACLSDLGNQTTPIKQDDKVVKAVGVASDGEFWTAKVLSTIEILEEDKKHVQTIEDIEEEDTKLFAKTRQILSKLSKISPSWKAPSKGAELLLIGILLERRCSLEDDETVDAGTLETCIDAVSRMLLSDDKKNKKTKQISDESVDEPVDVLVDTIIGFLEKSTSFMRTVGNHAFALLCGLIKESTVDLILTQLERRDPSQLLEDEDDEDEDMDDLSVDEEVESQSDDESDAEGSAGESDEEEEDPELRLKIEEALRVNGIEPATGETDSEDEELMDDDQMMAIDEQLAQVFRSRANERKSGKGVDAQREATHFKNRVLDLIDTYLKQQPSSPLVLRFITPLIDLVMGSGSDERQLSDKARGILRSRFSKAKEWPTEVDVEQVTLVATNLHIQARKAHSSELLSILSLCSVYLVKIFVHLKSEDALLDIYKQSFADFATRKNSALNSHFFQDFIRRFPALGWTLREDLIEFCQKSINGYRQSQFLQLFELLIGFLPTMPEKNDEAIKFMPLLKQLLSKLAEDSCDETSSLNASQMKELFKLALSALKQTKRISAGSTQSIWETKSWKSLQQKLKTSRFKSSTALHKMCEQIIRTLEASALEDVTSAPEPIKSKRKADAVNEDDVGTPGTKPTKRKKVKGNK